MTAIDIKNQIRQLLSQHLSQIESLMAEVNSKKSEAIYAGFAAGRDESRKNALEGEIAIWQSKMATGQTATRSISEAKATAGAFLQRKIEAKIEKMNSEQSFLESMLSYFKEKIESIKQQAAESGNPITDAMIELFNIFNDLIESILEEKDKKELNLTETVDSNESKISNLINDVAISAKDNKEIEQILSNQVERTENTIQSSTTRVSGQAAFIEKDQSSQTTQKQTLVDSINSIKTKLQTLGKDLSTDQLQSIEQLTKSDKDSKLVINKDLANNIYSDLVNLVGKDNVIIDRRENDRRNSSADETNNANNRDQSDRRSQEAFLIG